MTNENRVAELEALLELMTARLADAVEHLSHVDERIHSRDVRIVHLITENASLRARVTRQRRELTRLNRAQYYLQAISRLYLRLTQ